MKFLYSDRFGCEMAMPNDRRLRFGALFLSLLGVIAAWQPAVALALPKDRTYSVTSWTARDGMVTGRITTIAQDHDGYLWLGTSGGLVRFDGVRFTPWESEPKLPEGSVTALLVSRDGSLWLGFGSRDVVARVRGRRVKIYTLGGDTAGGFVRALLQDQNGVVWAAGYGGLWRHHDDQWERVRIRNGLPEGTVDTIYEDPSGDFWVGSVHGVYRRRNGADHFELVPAPPRVITPIRSFSAGPDGSIWIADPQGLTNIDRSGASVGQAWRVRGTPMDLLLDRQGVLWVGTLGQGVTQIFPGTPSPPFQTTRFTRREGLAHDEVGCLFEDREGNIWVGTRGGLSRLTESIVPVVLDRWPGEGVVHAVTTTTDGRVWVSSADGLRVLSQERWKRYGRAEGLPSDIVLALHADKTGGLWLTTDHGAGRFSAGRFSPLPLPSNIHRLIAISVDPDGGVWLSDLSMGLFRWKDGHLRSMEYVTGRRPAHCLYTDRRGRVWIGLRAGGVIMYEDGRFQSLGIAEGLAGGTVNAIHEDGDGTVWIATSNGVSTFRAGRVSTYRDPVLKNISAVMSDDNGYLWFGIASGVVRVHGSEFENRAAEAFHRMDFRLFTASDGVVGIPVRASSWPNATRGPRGSLWFATDQGVAIIDPRAVDDKGHTPPPVRIDGVIADDRTLEPSLQLRLPPLTSRIQINYTALSLAAPEKIRFRYKLEGFDDDWTDAGTRRQAFYTNLPPGTYRFRVSAYEEGVWNETSVAWEFFLAPAFYQTRWFLAICLVLLGFTVIAGWRMRIRGIRRRFSLVMAERARIGRDIHDSLLQGLVGALVQFDAVATQMDSTPEAAKVRLERARRQVEECVRETRQSIRGLRSATLERADLLTALREIGDAITAGTAVRFELAVVGKPRRCNLRLEEQLLKIGREGISNAVRHAQSTMIRMELRYEPDRVRLRVSDNGRGFDSNHAGGWGWGLIGMRERSEQIGGTFTIASDPAYGTRLEVMAPVA